MNTLIKTPAEKFPIYFNISYDLAEHESIVSYSLTCVNKATGADSSATIVDSDSLSSPEVMVVIKAGAEGDTHELTCVALTSGGAYYERDILIVIQTVVSDDFIKQPGATLLFAVEFERRIIPGDSLASPAVTAIAESTGASVSGTIVLTPNVVGSNIGVPVTGGADGETYRIGVKGTTAAGYVYEKTIRMMVQEG